MVCVRLIITTAYSLSSLSSYREGVLLVNNPAGLKLIHVTFDSKIWLITSFFSSDKIKKDNHKSVRYCTTNLDSETSLASRLFETKKLDTTLPKWKEMPYIENCLQNIVKRDSDPSKIDGKSKIFKLSELGEIGNFCTPEHIAVLAAMKVIVLDGLHSYWNKALQYSMTVTSSTQKPVVKADIPISVSDFSNPLVILIPGTVGSKKKDLMILRIGNGIMLAYRAVTIDWKIIDLEDGIVTISQRHSGRLLTREQAETVRWILRS